MLLSAENFTFSGRICQSILLQTHEESVRPCSAIRRWFEMIKKEKDNHLKKKMNIEFLQLNFKKSTLYRHYTFHSRSQDMRIF